MVHRGRWDTRLELRLGIVQCTEGVDHRKRGLRRLGKLTPVEFETIVMHAVAQTV